MPANSYPYDYEEKINSLTQKSATLCSDMGFDEISSDEDWADYRFNDGDGLVIMVAIDHENGEISVTRENDGEFVSRVEFSDEVGDQLDKVKKTLV